jgi:hypothetical protein
MMKNSACSIRVQSRFHAGFGTMNGLKQGDALPCLLFNVALEKVIQDSGIQSRGTIVYKLVQRLAYIFELDLISRTVVDLKEAFLSLFQMAKDMGLKINDVKTKYTVTGKSTISSPTISIGCCNFHKVESFVYLGTVVNSDGGVMMEMTARLRTAIKCFFGLVKHLSSKPLSREVKCVIYKALIRSVPTYGSQTWTVGKQGENLPRPFERKVLWKIFGPVLGNGC